MAQKQFLILIWCFLCEEHVLLLLEEVYDHHTHLLPLPLPLPLPLLRCLNKESTAQLFSKDFFLNRVATRPKSRP